MNSLFLCNISLNLVSPLILKFNFNPKWNYFFNMLFECLSNVIRSALAGVILKNILTYLLTYLLISMHVHSSSALMIGLLIAGPTCYDALP